MLRRSLLPLGTDLWLEAYVCACLICRPGQLDFEQAQRHDRGGVKDDGKVRWCAGFKCLCAALSTAPRRYEFSGATSAIYSFWQYELCDVYIELVKPVMTSPGQCAMASGL